MKEGRPEGSLENRGFPRSEIAERPVSRSLNTLRPGGCLLDELDGDRTLKEGSGCPLKGKLLK